MSMTVAQSAGPGWGGGRPGGAAGESAGRSVDRGSCSGRCGMLYLPHSMTAEMKLPTRASGVR